jgi:hypothetical protein
VLVRYFYQGIVAKRQGSLYWNSAFRSEAQGDFLADAAGGAGDDSDFA